MLLVLALKLEGLLLMLIKKKVTYKNKTELSLPLTKEMSLCP